MSESKYSRRTVIAAADILKSLGHAGLGQFFLEMDLNRHPDPSGGLQGRVTALAKYLVDNPAKRTEDGVSLWDAVVDRAHELDSRFPDQLGLQNVTKEEQQKFRAAYNKDLGAPESVPPFISPTKEDPSIWQKAQVWSNAGVQNEKTKLSSSTVVQPSTQPAWPTQMESQSKTEYPRRVFIVHGHDELMKQSVARVLQQLDFEEIILHEQVNKGRSIIEKFEDLSDVGFVVVLLSPDDPIAHGQSFPETRRPRQNVILEWGYFMGKLTRKRVFALRKGNPELPTDTMNIVWEQFDEAGAWKYKLAAELEAADYTVDRGKIR